MAIWAMGTKKYPLVDTLHMDRRWIGMDDMKINLFHKLAQTAEWVEGKICRK